MARIIESPGVQISEIDLSLRSSLPIGTNILVNGFADQGPSYELLNVTSIQEYEQIYGTPTNAAERYSYYTVKNLLSTSAKVVFNRLPYGVNGGNGYNNTYTALMYPIYSSTGSQIALSSVSGDTLYIGRPTQVSISESTYNNWKQGGINWDTMTNSLTVDISGAGDVGKSGFVVINKLQTGINQDFEGYYIGLSDNSQSTATAVSGDFEFASIKNVYTSKESVSGITLPDTWAELSDSRLGFSLTGNASDEPDSISEAVEGIPTWDFGNTEYNDGLILGLYKFRRSAYNQTQNALSFVPYESYVFSLGADRRYTEPKGFQDVSFFAENIVNNDSTFLEVFVNRNLSETNWISNSGKPSTKFRILTAIETATAQLSAASGNEANAVFSLGLYQDKYVDAKIIGDIPTKLSTGLTLAEDWEVLPLDIVLDAGLSTIHATTQVLSGYEDFDDTRTVPASAYAESDDKADSAWLTIFNKFDIFCRDTRKDCMYIADVYRNILINGKDFKTLDDKTKNFSQHIYAPLKNLISACNSNYSATYAQWCKVYDNYSRKYVWIPYSGFQGAIMARLDSTLYPWSAPAGLENGLVVGALDVALSTTQKHRDLLYRNNLNPVVFFPSDGITCWGQKTLQKKPSAFDRINVRRLFLTLEKSTRGLMKYFIFQPNSTFTRTRVVNTLTPIFDVAKNNEGVYDYLIVCDERNNTAQVIDNNELQVDIYLKPVRTAEFVLVNFFATRTNQDFSELI